MSKMNKTRTVNTLRILYLIWAVLGGFSILYVSGNLVVDDDALVTTQNIIASELLFRAGIIGSLLTQLMFIAVAWFLYELFESVHKKAAQVMMIFVLVSVPMAMYNEIHQLAVLNVLDQPDQVLFYSILHAQGIDLAAIFWGLWLFPLGYLVFHSGYFPKVIGVALYIGGVGYLLGTISKFLFPEIELLRWIADLMTMGEIVWLLWLIVRGARLSFPDNS
jgi:hypothetical protein